MKKRLFLIVGMVLVLVALMSISAAASQTVLNLEIDGIQDYDEVMTIFNRVNQERSKENLKPLTLDPQLTGMAMQRAAEIAIYYDHTRPDNTRCFTITAGTKFSGGAMGENIAIGYQSGELVMNGWMNSQGHRENILYDVFTTIGIGCFYQENGHRCWVQLFSSKSYDSYQPSGTKAVSAVPIKLDTALMGPVGIKQTNSNGEVELFEGMKLPISVEMTNGGWEYMTAELSGGFTVSSMDPAVAEVDMSDMVIRGNAPGETTVDLVLDGKVTAPVKVIVREKPVLSYYIDEYGYLVITWDSIEDCLVYCQEPGDDIWYNKAYTSYSDSFTIWNPVDGGTYTVVMRQWIGDELVDVGDPLVIRAGVPQAPKVTATNIKDSGKIKLTWTAVKGATKYEIYRATSKTGKYSKLGTVTGTGYTHATAKAGTKYYYKVRALSASGVSSDDSKVVAIVCDLARPNVSITLANGKPKLTWKAVEGATGYDIYRATSKDGKYSKLRTVTSTSYSNPSAKAGTTYYYRVRAVCGNADGNSSFDTVSITARLARPDVTITLVDGKPKLTWKAVEGATGYDIYRATSKDGKYSKLRTVTSTSYSNPSAKADTKYYYRVRAVCGKYAGYSTFDTVSITTKLARPDVTITLSSGKPKLTWKAVPGATAYEIYRATSKDGKYSKLNTVTKTSYTNPSAKAGTRYYYKVRAICSYTACNSAYDTVSIRAN